MSPSESASSIAPDARRPNFCIIGAAKSGTTALFQYLAQHPQVFVSEPKEPHFLAFANQTPSFRGPYDKEIINDRAVTDIAAYERLFQKSQGFPAVGEASVSTLYYHESSIPNIERYIPECKLLCMLRNPVARAYSAYMYYISLTRETVMDFGEAWRLEARRIEENYHHIWHYGQMGLYSLQLAPFMRAFSKDQLRVWLYDDFRDAPEKVVRESFEFIGVDAAFRPAQTPQPLVSGRPRNMLVQRILGRPSGWKEKLKDHLPAQFTKKLRGFITRRNLSREEMAPEMRELLIEFYQEDVEKLQDLLGRDLSHWLKTSTHTKNEAAAGARA
jgi:hypothetical protein